MHSSDGVMSLNVCQVVLIIIEKVERILGHVAEMDVRNIVYFGNIMGKDVSNLAHFLNEKRM